MKRKFLVVLVAVFLIAITTSFAACKIDMGVNDCTHDFKETSVLTEVTCTTAGSVEETCALCGETRTTEKAALGHDMKPVAEKAATCFEAGYAAYEQCSRCDHNTKGDETPALNHVDDNNDHICDYCNLKASDHAGGTATCTKKAVCSTCGNEYGDYAEHTIVLDTTQGENGYTWTSDYSSCVAHGKCDSTGCAHTEDTTATVTPTQKQALTCLNDETYDYTASFTVTWAETQTLTDIVKTSATGHNYGAISCAWNDAHTAFIATRTCPNCSKDIEGHTQTATSTSHSEYAVTTKPTCTEAGEADYVVWFDVEWIEGYQLVSGWYPPKAHVLSDCEFDMNNHGGVCTGCKTSVTEAHSFDDDCKCVCGFVKGTDDVRYGYDSTLKTYYADYFYPADGATAVDVVIANYYDGSNGFLPVTYIRSFAFSGNNSTRDKIKSVIIPEGITKIDGCAFSSCTNLASVTLPDSLEYLGNDAFQDTAWEKSYLDTQIEGEVYIGNILYTYKGTMTEDYTLNINEGTKLIAPGAFYNQRKLKVVNMPDSLTFIGDAAFRYCWNLQTIQIGINVKTIVGYAFSDCKNLQTITFNSKLETIEDYAFAYCEAIKTLTIPSSVKTIGSSAFSSMDLLESVVIEGSGLTYIDEYAFFSCPKLTSITFSVSLEKLKEISKDVWYMASPNVTVYYDGGSFKVHYDKADSTCTEDGNIEYWYNFIDGKNYSHQYFYSDTIIENSVVIPAGHTGGTATCQAKAICTVCGNEYGDLADHDFDETTWAQGETSHYHACKTSGCTEVKDETEHVYQYDVCKDCGYEADGLKYTYNAENETYTVRGYKGAQTETTIPRTYNDGTNGEEKVVSINENAFLNTNIATIYNYSDVVIDDTAKTTYGLNENVTIHTCQIVDGFDLIIGKTEDTVIGYRGDETVITLPLSFFDDKLYTIADGAFSDSGITEVYNHGVLDVENHKGKYGLSDSVALFGRKITASGIVYIQGKTSDTVIGLTGYSYSLILPDAFTEGKPYTIKSQAFRDNTFLYKITFGAGLTEIGENAFANSRIDTIYNASAIEIDVANNTYGIKSSAKLYTSHLYDGFSVMVGETEDVVVGYDGSNSDLVFPDYFTEGHTYSIAYRTFQNNRFVTSVTFGAGLTEIGEKAFDTCRKLQTVKFAEDCQITSIGVGAFMACYALTTVQLPTRGILQTIDNDAFYLCYRLIDMVIPDSVTEIGNNAFQCCYSLSSVTLGKGLTTIGTDAFWSTSKLIELINLSQTLTIQSGEYGLSGSVIVKTENNSGIVKQGDYNFYSVTVTDSETNVETTKHYLVDYVGTDSVITLPSYFYNGVAVDYEIYSYAFFCCTTLTKVTIPNCVTAIGIQAFGSGREKSVALDYLTEVVFQEGSKLTAIGSMAFSECRSLTSFTIPQGVTTIGEDAFIACYSLFEVVNLSTLAIEQGSEDYGRVAFFALLVVNNNEDASKFDENGYRFASVNGENYLIGYSGTDSVLTLPSDYNGETYAIYDNVFYGNEIITSVFIPDNVTAIGAETFYNCINLRTVTFGNNSKLETIFGSAFVNCTSLTTITIPASVKKIGLFAFSNNVSLTYFGFESGSLLTDFAHNLFNGCVSLTVVDLGECNYLTSLPSTAFCNCKELTMVTLPDNLTSIDYSSEDGAFKNCNSLKYNEYENAYYLGSKSNPYMVLVKVNDAPIEEFFIFDEAKIILANAFDGCQVGLIYIPSDVSCIQNNAFYGCENLETIFNESSIKLDSYADRHNRGIGSSVQIIEHV